MAKALHLLSLTSYLFSNSPFLSHHPLLPFSLSLLSISSLAHHGFVIGLDLLFFSFGWLWLNLVVVAVGGLWMFVVAMVGCSILWLFVMVVEMGLWWWFVWLFIYLFIIIIKSVLW